MLEIAIVQRFLPGSSRGGVGHFAHGFANALVDCGHRVTVVTQDAAGPDARYRTLRLPRPTGGLRAKLEPLVFPLRVARQDLSNFDLVHAQGDDQFIAHRSRPPLVRTLQGSALLEAVHNGLRRGSPKRFAMHSYFYACELLADLRADAVVAVSAHTARFYPRVHAVVPNGIDLARFAPDGTPKSERPSILFVGELASRKRGHLLLDVVRRVVRPQVPDLEVWLVSPDRVEERGVVCLGHVDDARLATLYRAAWVLCLPSSYEGFGRPYVEAMAAGTAVVATANPGAREVLDGGRYGLVTDERGLGGALCAMLTRADLRDRYVEQGLERARAYRWERVVERYERIYESILRPREGRRTT